MNETTDFVVFKRGPSNEYDVSRLLFSPAVMKGERLRYTALERSGLGVNAGLAAL